MGKIGLGWGGVGFEGQVKEFGFYFVGFEEFLKSFE